MAGKPLTDLTPEKRRELFLAQLRKEPNITRAAHAAGYTRQYAYQLREADPDFAEAWKEALEESVDLAESEMHRRAFKGTVKPVFHQGERCGGIREYSDTLAIFLMKAHRPEKYRETVRNELTGANGGPIQHADVAKLTDAELERIIASSRGGTAEAQASAR
jgi:hypothetical protein